MLEELILAWETERAPRRLQHSHVGPGRGIGMRSGGWGLQGVRPGSQGLADSWGVKKHMAKSTAGPPHPGNEMGAQGKEQDKMHEQDGGERLTGGQNIC